MSNPSLRRAVEPLQASMPDGTKEPTAPAWGVKIASLEGRVENLDAEVRDIGRRQEAGFERMDRNVAALAGQITAANTKPPPYGLILSALVGLATILIGFAGLGITCAGGLALWANAYFGRSIQIAEASAEKANVRVEALAAMQETKIDKLLDRTAQNAGDIRVLQATEPKATP